jgi:DNA-binding NtrC family response regulator
VRVIAATNRDLRQMVAGGKFQEDLYYRLNVIPIAIPPLRERRDDIPALVRHFTARFAAEEGKSFIRGVNAPALNVLSRYDWPGNVRQLENAVFRAVVLADAPVLTPEEFPQIAAHVDGNAWAAEAARDPVPAKAEAKPEDDAVESVELDFGLPLSPEPTSVSGQLTALGPDGEVRPLAEIEAAMIKLALERYAGRMTLVARRLGIGRSTLYRKLKELGISDTVAGIAAE